MSNISTNEYKPSILYVEDAPDIGSLVKLYFKVNTNIFVDLAMVGRVAIAKLRESHYDIIMIDHSLPDMDGIDLVEDIRSGTVSNDENIRNIVIISCAVHEYAFMKAFQKYKNHGVIMLGKPFDIVEMDDMISQVLSRKGISVVKKY